MPKAPRKLVKRGGNNRRWMSNRRRNNRRHPSGSPQVMSVLRRLVLYPTVTDASWLSKLSWYASIALKLFTTVFRVTDDFEALSCTTGAGSVMILGPGDFAALSPYAVPVTTTRSDKEVKMLKSFPFERCSMRSIKVDIIPSADLGVRGGMFAALLIPVDTVDATTILEMDKSSSSLVDKFSADYDDLIKHPRAKMGPVTRPMSLTLRTNSTPHNIRIVWSNDKGFVNTFPSCALLVAFSDLATNEKSINDSYTPAKSLFEVHLRASISFHDPAELSLSHDSGSATFSCFTPKPLTTTSKDLNKPPVVFRTVKFFDRRYNVQQGKELSLLDIPEHEAITMLEHYDRSDLIPALKAKFIEKNLIAEVEDFELCSP